MEFDPLQPLEHEANRLAAAIRAAHAAQSFTEEIRLLALQQTVRGAIDRYRDLDLPPGPFRSAFTPGFLSHLAS